MEADHAGGGSFLLGDALGMFDAASNGDEEGVDDVLGVGGGESYYRAKASVALADAGSGDGGRGFLLFRPSSHLFAMDFPETQWLVRGLVPEEAVTFISGEPKTAKTWHGLELAVAIATATKAFGEFWVPRPRNVHLVLVESSEREARNRLRAIGASRGLSPEQTTARISYSCRPELDLRQEEDVQRLVGSVLATTDDCGLLLLDPLRDLHTGKENEADSMAPVMRNLRRIRGALKCAVGVIHHSRKGGDGDSGRPGQRMRGSSVIHATADAGIYLHDHKGDGSTHWVSKVQGEIRNGKSAGAFWSRLDITDNEEGEGGWPCWKATVTGSVQLPP